MSDAIPQAALAAIGTVKTCRYEVTARDIKRFAQAIDDPNPVYVDAAYASTTRHGGIVAPPLFGHAFAFEDVPVAELAPDGSPVEFNVPVPATRAVGGGSVYECFRRIRPGDRLEVETCIKDVFSKDGKSGRLYFVVVETSFRVGGDLAARETATFVKR